MIPRIKDDFDVKTEIFNSIHQTEAERLHQIIEMYLYER